MKNTQEDQMAQIASQIANGFTSGRETDFSWSLNIEQLEDQKSLPCYKCGTLIDIDILDENGAYTYPDNLPYCPNCNPNQ